MSDGNDADAGMNSGEGTGEGMSTSGGGGPTSVVWSRTLGKVLILVFFLAVAVGYTSYAHRNLDFGRMRLPGPAFWPFIVGIAIIIIALIAIIEAVVVAEDNPIVDWPVGEDGRRVIAFASTVLAFVFSLYHLGFLVSGIWATAVLIRVLGRDPWWKASLAGVLMTSVIYWFFTSVLRVRFPNSTFIPAVHF